MSILGRHLLRVDAPPVRRAHALVACWEDDGFVVRNYLSGRRVRVDPIVVHLLDGFSAYVNSVEAGRKLGEIPGAGDLLGRLVEQDILLERGSELDELDLRVQREWRWGHDARCFHFGTRDVPYEPDIAVQRRSLLRLKREEEPAGPFKRLAGSYTRLPAGRDGLDMRLGRALLRRRTRRRHSSDPLSLNEFSRVVAWTWGATHVVEEGEIGPYVLKTSPSGGSRHPIEVYPIVRRVDGLDPGVYYYDVRDSAVLRTGPPPDDGAIDAIFAGQPSLAAAPVLFLMAARLARSDWKYRHSHAYRVLLLDAGHLGQTFHLVCTAMGLAPFTLAGFQDSRLEACIGIDGVTEIPLYVAACGLPAK